MVQIELENSSLGEIVVADFRAASVFKKANIDFCCGGKKTLHQACKEKGLDLSSIESELRALQLLSINPTQNFNDWSVEFLASFIKNTHHKYVLSALPDLLIYTDKIAKVHGENHPELVEVANLFLNINTELLQHLKKEEEVLFPAISEVVNSNSLEAKAIIVSEIARMNDEHEFAGGAMDKIAELTNHYAIPQDACNTYRVCLQLLEQFEDDLHVHVHLENNLIYPKALAL